MRRLWIAVLGLLIVLGAVAVFNYARVGAALADAAKTDPRNAGVRVSAHFEYYVVPSSLVFDLVDVADDKSPSDVFRLLLMFAARVKDQQFERVVLAHRGQPKFLLQGDYFKQLGTEYGTQNVIYTIRTFPENLHRPDGSRAYESWTDGWIGVVGKQMEDFNTFHRDWYVNDLAKH